MGYFAVDLSYPTCATANKERIQFNKQNTNIELIKYIYIIVTDI